MSNINKKVDVTLHIDEETSHKDREDFCGTLLELPGVITASYHDERPHLLVIKYDPDTIVPKDFVVAARICGLHSELIGML